MKELINISGQQFYYSTIDQVTERCSQKGECAIIIDKSYLDEFLIKGEDIIGECVNQLIIISGDVKTALTQLKGVSVLLITAENLEEGVRIAILGSALSKEVVCVPKEDEKATSNIIEEIVG